MLFAQLEDCVHFLVTIGGSALKEFNGSQKLEDYLLSTLLIDKTVWKQMSSPTMCQQVELRHLRSLIESLEEKMHGDPLDKVELRYRAALPQAFEQLLRNSQPRLNGPLVVAELRGLMLEQLTKTTWPADSSLKQYLIHSSAEDLEEEEWFMEHFPDELQLAHAFATHKLLSTLTGEQ